MYKYTHFIPENIAPQGAQKLSVYDDAGNKICSIALGGLTPLAKAKLYSVGIVSDLHFALGGEGWSPSYKFDKALTYFEQQGCKFCCVSGDLTQTGFYTEAAPDTFDDRQFKQYKDVCENHKDKIIVYELCGNHESYSKPITKNLEELSEYTGAKMYYAVAQGNDVFIFLSQPNGGTPMTETALQWLYGTLEANRDKRCFIFVHPYLGNGDVNGIYGSTSYLNVFKEWGTNTTLFTNLLKHYKNTVLFHGHTHFMFECQELDKTVNYSAKGGFKSVHVPSLTRPRTVIDGIRYEEDSKSQGYIMDVYKDCIVLNGIDFINNAPVPLGTFKIDTPKQTIQEKSFNDTNSFLDLDTGTFLTNVDVEHSYDTITSTNYTVIRVRKQRLNGTYQYPFVYAPNGIGTLSKNKSALDLSKAVDFPLIINAGIFNTANGQADGIVIQNGMVIQNTIAESHPGAMPLTIDKDGNLGYANANANANDLVANGIVSAVCGFFPIVENSQAVSTDVLKIADHYATRAQRQIIGQWDNGDYAIITCEGRGFNNSNGWTLAEAQAICIARGLKFAYNLDGGGSTETVLNKEQLNTIYEGNTGRPNPTFIVFNGGTTPPPTVQER